MVLVLGDAGMGKTCLVEHWLHSLGDVPTVRVRADVQERMVELSTAEHLLRELTRRSVRRPSGVVEAGTALLEALSAEPEPDDVDVVFVDDLHWADPSSVDALAFALRAFGTNDWWWWPPPELLSSRRRTRWPGWPISTAGPASSWTVSRRRRRRRWYVPVRATASTR